MYVPPYGTYTSLWGDEGQASSRTAPETGHAPERIPIIIARQLGHWHSNFVVNRHVLFDAACVSV